MENKNQQTDEDSNLFAGMIMMLGTAAWQQLGKTPSHANGKCEVNLDAAEASIEMLAMLNRKTAGNLSANEDRMLKALLADLQMNFFETTRDQTTTKTQDPQPNQTQPTADADISQPDNKSGKEAKYHKSYG